MWYWGQPLPDGSGKSIYFNGMSAQMSRTRISGNMVDRLSKPNHVAYAQIDPHRNERSAIMLDIAVRKEVLESISPQKPCFPLAFSIQS